MARYKSRYTGAQIDAGIQAARETIPSQLATIGLKLGDLANLETTAKSNAVAAINEINGKVGSIASGKYYGYYGSASALPTSGNEDGYAYVGATAPYSIYNGVSNGGTMSWTDSGSKISSASVADEEDITQDSNGKLSLKDRGATDGMGYVILRKNKTFAEQVTKADTIYEIRYDFDLDGASVTIPSGCVLKFDGGSINNGTLVFADTLLQGNPVITTRFSGTLTNQIVETKWFNNDHLLHDVFAVSENRVIEFESREFQCAYAITIPSCIVHGNGAVIRLLDTDEKATPYDSAFKIANKHYLSTSVQDEIKIYNLNFITASTVGVHLFALSSTKNLHLKGCSFVCEKPDVTDYASVTLHCFDLDGNDTNVLIEDCRFENHCDNGESENGNGGGVWIRVIADGVESNGIVFRNCKIYNTCADEMLGVLPLKGDVNDITFDNCFFEYERIADSLRTNEGSYHITFHGSHNVNKVLFTNCTYYSNFLPNTIFSGRKIVDGLVKNCKFTVSGVMPYMAQYNSEFAQGDSHISYEDCDFSFDVVNATGNTQSDVKPVFGANSTLRNCRIHLGGKRLIMSWVSLRLSLEKCTVESDYALYTSLCPTRIADCTFLIDLQEAGVAFQVTSQSSATELLNNTFICTNAMGRFNFPSSSLFSCTNNFYKNIRFTNYTIQERSLDETFHCWGDAGRRTATVQKDLTNSTITEGTYFYVIGTLTLSANVFLPKNITLDFTKGGKIAGSFSLFMNSTKIVPAGINITEVITAPRQTLSGNVMYATGQILTVSGKLCRWDGEQWLTLDGYPNTYSSKGTTAQRPTPTSADAGFQYYDTTLGKYICWNGTDWVNMDGSALS